MEKVMEYGEAVDGLMDSEEMAAIMEMQSLMKIPETQAFAKLMDLEGRDEALMKSEEFQALFNEDEIGELMMLPQFSYVMNETWVTNVTMTDEFMALADEYLWGNLTASEEMVAINRYNNEKQADETIKMIKSTSQEDVDEMIAEFLDVAQKRLTRVRTYPYVETYEEEGIELQESIDEIKDTIRTAIKGKIEERAKKALKFMMIVYVVVPIVIAILIVVLLCCCCKRKKAGDDATPTGGVRSTSVDVNVVN